MKLKNCMFCLLDKLSRWRHSLGFGIQSPWAYSFVKDVIADKKPDGCDENTLCARGNSRERRRQRLYRRLQSRYPDYRFCSAEELSTEDGDGETLVKISPVLVVEGIRASDSAFKAWLRLRDNEAVGITFDLCDIAICFPRNNMFKQHYKLKY